MTVHRYDVLGSTNLQLMKMADRDAAAWSVVIADSQEDGIGRSGRAWWSPPGGLYMSVLVKPRTGIENISRLPILASLAVLDGIGETKTPLRVKWPNDILVGERKLAGILIQARIERKKALWVVAGFGVNIHRPESEPPEEIRDRIAFARDLRGEITRDSLAEAIVSGFKGRIDTLDDRSWEKAVREWSRSASWDRDYTHHDGKREIRGKPVRLAGDGGLVLLTDDGEVTVHSGEINETVQSPESRV